MNKKRVGTVLLLLSLCLCLIPCRVQAASTADAAEPIAPEKECSLTLSYCYDKIPFTCIEVKVYKIAQFSSDLQFTLDADFQATGLELNGIRTSGEWKVVRSTLGTYVIANGIGADLTATTDQNGQIHLGGLEAGLYFATALQITQDELRCRFDSAILSLPDLGADGLWIYDVSASAKPELIPPSEPDKEIELKVLKLWRGDDGRSDRPESVEIEIFRDGVSHATALLSAENNWSYSWSAKDDGADWTVAERNVPSGYAVTVEERDGSFILTNTFIPEGPDDPDKPPATGDTTNLLTYILLMSASGCALIAIGAAGKRRLG